MGSSSGQRLPSEAALGLPQQAVEVQGAVLALGGGRIEVVRVGVWKWREKKGAQVSTCV